MPPEAVIVAVPLDPSKQETGEVDGVVTIAVGSLTVKFFNIEQPLADVINTL